MWLPYLRGERTPFHDPRLQASLHGLDIANDPDSLERASHEASGFVIRRLVELSGVEGPSHRGHRWGLPVGPLDAGGGRRHRASRRYRRRARGGALGAAFLARLVSGLESDFQASGKWAGTGRRFEPDPTWAAAAAVRFARFESMGTGIL